MSIDVFRPPPRGGQGKSPVSVPPPGAGDQPLPRLHVWRPRRHQHRPVRHSDVIAGVLLSHKAVRDQLVNP